MLVKCSIQNCDIVDIFTAAIVVFPLSWASLVCLLP